MLNKNPDCPFFSESVVESYIDSVFELPAIAYSVIGECMSPFKT